MNLIKKLLILSNFVSADILPNRPGSQLDIHGCVSDGGYSWCESTQECIRQWITPCQDKYTDCNDCLQRQRNGENIACPISCDNIMIQNPCSLGCPPPVPCPAPGPNCNYIPPLVDNCGCTNGCGSMNCHPIDIIPSEIFSGENEVCGGYMPANMVHRCLPGLECVNVMGPMIVDAPGKCKRLCLKDSLQRDQYGNCVEANCRSWFDGCNNCLVGENGQLGCSERFCQNPTTAHCNDNVQTQLKLNDICYQFCEDNSQPFINKRNFCPTGSTCSSTQLSEISFDNCADRTLRCVQSGH